MKRSSSKNQDTQAANTCGRLPEVVETFQSPRRAHLEDIKLLRLELYSSAPSPYSLLGCDWSAAQPTESLSPAAAASSLRVSPFAEPSEVARRYFELQLRYPPESFSARHALWRPSAELLSEPIRRLNWYWQSGLVPLVEPGGAQKAWCDLRQKFFDYLGNP